jgi:hypothetical protein
LEPPTLCGDSDVTVEEDVAEELEAAGRPEKEELDAWALVPEWLTLAEVAAIVAV